MIVVKYGAVIGRETRFFICAQLQFPGYDFCKANHSAVFNHDHLTTEFAKRQFKLQWLTDSHTVE